MKGYEPMCRIDKDEYIDEYKKLTDIVHGNGANIIAQLLETSIYQQMKYIKYLNYLQMWQSEQKKLDLME